MVAILSWDTIAPGRSYHAAVIRLPAAVRRFPSHTHADFLEFMLVTEGAALHLLNGVSQTLQRGDLVLVRPTDVHEVATGVDRGVEFINVALTVSTWTNLAVASALAPDYLRRSTPHDDVSLVVTVEGDDLASVEATFRAAHAAFNAGSSGLELARLWVTLMMIMVDRVGATDSVGPAWLTAACRAMASEENLRGGVPRMAELAAVSRGHLARTMQSTFGQSPVEHVTELRLSHAAALLASTDEPVGTIARRCGFASTSYFSRQFTNRFQISPRPFRAQRVLDQHRLLGADQQ